MLSSGVSVAATVLLITSLASCTSNKDALKTYQDPKFIAKMKSTDPKYYKYIYYETTDSTGKTVAKIRKQHLTNPAMFGKEPNQSYRGKSCLRGGHCPTYGSADVSKGYGYGEHTMGEIKEGESTHVMLDLDELGLDPEKVWRVSVFDEYGNGNHAEYIIKIVDPINGKYGENFKSLEELLNWAKKNKLTA